MKRQSPKILVIDDDPIFSEVITRLAKESGSEVTICHSVADLAYLAVEQAFDVAVIDYYLDGLKEKLKGTDLLSSLKNIPVVLVSRAENIRSEEWPHLVRSFVNKNEGAKVVLDAALAEAETQRLKLLAQISEGVVTWR